MKQEEIVDLVEDQVAMTVRRSTLRSRVRTARIANQLSFFGLLLIPLLVCFAKPLVDLFRLSLKSDLASHIPLIPLISVYLIWTKRRELPLASKPFTGLAILSWVAGLSSLAACWIFSSSGADLKPSDYLSLTIFAFVAFVWANGLFVFGKATVRAVAFPFLFLVFMVPLPAVLRDWIEIFLQHASAGAAYVMLSLSGTTVFRDGLELRVPGVAMAVAQECSGIRSSMVLFIVSLIASHLFLRTRWKKTVLVLAVIPLAVLRNGFRIFTLAQLCIHVSPDMIHSIIHRRGGPIFFLLSLIPFFALLWFLQRSESKSTVK